MPLKFADAGWATAAVTAFGGLTMARWIHRVAGVVLLVTFVYHVVHLFVLLRLSIKRDRAAGTRMPLRKRVLLSPMMLTHEDFRQFGQLMMYLLFVRRERPRFGHFNFTQKFEYWAVFWGAPVMGLSGLALWNMPVVSSYLSGRALDFAYIIHSDEAYLAFIYIATVHFFSVIFTPVVFPLSLGTLTGQAPVHELAEGHRGQLERIAEEFEVALPKAAGAHHGVRRVGDVFQSLLKRAYSVALLGAYGLLAFVSLRFLVLMLIMRQSAPVEIVGIPKRLDAAFLAAPAAHRAAGEEATPPRGPLAHYHQIPPWFAPDPGNGCTAADCHAPLPHGKRIAVRAFLNMHTTFLDCGVCHIQQRPANYTAGWFGLPQRQPTATPALLRLWSRLEEDQAVAPADAPAESSRLIALIEAALPASHGNLELKDWLLRMQTTHPRSRVWSELVTELRDNIHLHVHGEYAAKIGLYVNDQLLGTLSADARTAADTWRRDRGKQTPEVAKALLDRVHEGVAPTGALCTPCHSAEPTLVDISQLGYPPERVSALRDEALVRSVLSIERGERFSLPLPPEPTTQPADGR
jgi:cytochrome b subunit of formate dehydrogenase